MALIIRVHKLKFDVIYGSDKIDNKKKASYLYKSIDIDTIVGISG